MYGDACDQSIHTCFFWHALHALHIHTSVMTCHIHVDSLRRIMPTSPMAYILCMLCMQWISVHVRHACYMHIQTPMHTCSFYVFVAWVHTYTLRAGRHVCMHVLVQRMHRNTGMQVCMHAMCMYVPMQRIHRTSMYACAQAGVNAYMHIHAHMHACIFYVFSAWIHTYMHVYARACTCRHTCTYMHTHAHTYTCKHPCINAQACIHAHTCTYMNIHTHAGINA
jgi:hypothetical protein